MLSLTFETKMVFTNVQNNNFFTNDPQTTLNTTSCNCLAVEGLIRIDDFEDSKEEQLKDAIKNLHTMIPGISAVLDAGGNVVTSAVHPIFPCLIAA